jgi:hypothetical protein
VPWRKAICFGAVLCAVLLAAPLAWAQKVQITGYSRSDNSCGLPSGDAGPLQFDPCSGLNYAACASDTTFTFTLSVSDPNMGSDHLAVLAGPSGVACLPAPGTDAGTGGTPAGCWPVVEGSPSLSSTMTVTVRAQDVAAYLGNASPPATYTKQTDPAVACESQTCPGVVNISIYFIIEASNGEIPATEYESCCGPGEFLLHAATLGPQAPGDVQVIVNDGYVSLSWEAPADPSIYGYNVYCQNYGKIDAALPGEGAAAPSEEASCSDAEPCINVDDAGSTSGECPNKSFGYVYTKPACASNTTPIDSPTTAPALEASLDEAATAVTTEGGVATPVTTSAGISQINASTTVPCPPGSVCLCAYPGDGIDGSQTGGPTTTSALFSAKNYDFYVYAVAAVDVLGNVGPPGNVQCGTPGPLDDFWDRYTTDGGLAGGGYCALEGVGMPAGSACMTVGVGLAAVGLFRRRRKRD